MVQMTAIQALTLFALWTLAILVFGVGLHRWRMILTGRARINAWPADPDHGPPFYRRLMRAHANCVETLPVFAAAVFSGEIQGLSTGLFDQAATMVLLARIGQSLAHIASGSELAVAIRFGFFLVQLCAMALMGIIALG